MLSLSLPPTAHPRTFQRPLVRASTRCYPGFTLAMGSSLGFGSAARDCVALFALAFASAPPVSGINLAAYGNSRTHYAKGKPPSRMCGTTTPCRHTVSGPISLPYQGCFSPFPHGTSSLSVIGEYLALGGGPPGFRQAFTCPALLGIPLGSFRISPTGLSPSVGALSRAFRLSIQIPRRGPATPRCKHRGLGCSPFARHY